MTYDPRKVEGIAYEASYYSVRSIFLLLTSSNDSSIFLRNVSADSIHMFFRDGPRFKPNVSIVFINHDHDHDHCHYYHHFSKELFRYYSVCFVFYVSSLLSFVICVLMFCCFCYWLLNQLNFIII